MMLPKPLRAQINFHDPDNLPGTFTTTGYVPGTILHAFDVRSEGAKETWWWLRLDDLLVIDGKYIGPAAHTIRTKDFLLDPSWRMGGPRGESILSCNEVPKPEDLYVVLILLVPQVAKLERARVSGEALQDKPEFRMINAGWLRILPEQSVADEHT